MFKLIFYVPTNCVEIVKNAIFKTGAGQLGNYSHCSWQVLGDGQFKPLSGSKPTLGSEGNIERVKEFRVEILCLEDNIKLAVDALKSSHPYEEVAYEVISLLNY